MLALYQWSFGTAFHAWIPNEQDMDWLSRQDPDTFDRYYRPRWEHIKKMAASGTPYANYGLAKLCQTRQLPAVFSEPGDPTRPEEHTSAQVTTAPPVCRSLLEKTNHNTQFGHH